MPSAKQRQADRFGDLLLEQAAGPLSLAEEAAAAEASLLRMPGAVLIPIERLAANPDNPRHRLGNVEELALSLADRGALQALLVRRDLERPGYYLVVAGNRRLAAAQLIRAGAIAEVQVSIDNLPCVIAEDAGADAFADAMAENVAREDLTRAEMMDGVLRLHRHYGWSARAISRRLGRHHTDMAELLRLASDPEVAHLVRSELVSPTVGAQISDLPPSSRERAIEAVGTGSLRTARDLARVVAGGDDRAGAGIQPPANGASARAGIASRPPDDPASGSEMQLDSPADSAVPASSRALGTGEHTEGIALPVPPKLAAVGRRNAAARHAAQSGLRRVAQLDEEEFQAVLDLLSYGKAYRKQWQAVIDELTRERSRTDRPGHDPGNQGPPAPEAKPTEGS